MWNLSPLHRKITRKRRPGVHLQLFTRCKLISNTKSNPRHRCNSWVNSKHLMLSGVWLHVFLPAVLRLLHAKYTKSLIGNRCSLLSWLGCTWHSAQPPPLHFHICPDCSHTELAGAASCRSASGMKSSVSGFYNIHCLECADDLWWYNLT